MSGTKPTVCIGVPCYQDVSPTILEDWMRFAYHCGRRLPQFDFFLAIKSKSEQFRARNAIVEAAQQVGADWLLMLDDDMIVNPFGSQGPTDAYALVEKLMAHGKDVCGALYYQRGGACRPVLMAKVPDTKGYRFLRDDEVAHKLQRVDVAGGGCLLINMRVFDKIPSPCFAPEFEFGTDIQICKKATEAGFEVWADTSIELGHLRQERTTITSQNRHRFQIDDALPGELKQTVYADVFTSAAEDARDYLHFSSVDAMTKQVSVSQFLHEKPEFEGSDADWYRTHATERIVRQVWYQIMTPEKRQMTEFILASISDKRPLNILDFGCGIGIPAFALSERGHRVTACDIEGTSTFEFLKWRAKKHQRDLTFLNAKGGVTPLHGEQFDVIIAMDSLEHIKDWRRMLTEIAEHLVPDGVLFANNAVLNDWSHPEHYIDCTGASFVSACAENHLLPVNQITYLYKPAVRVVRSDDATYTDSVA